VGERRKKEKKDRQSDKIQSAPATGSAEREGIIENGVRKTGKKCAALRGRERRAASSALGLRIAPWEELLKNQKREAEVIGRRPA